MIFFYPFSSLSFFLLIWNPNTIKHIATASLQWPLQQHTLKWHKKASGLFANALSALLDRDHISLVVVFAFLSLSLSLSLAISLFHFLCHFSLYLNRLHSIALWNHCCTGFTLNMLYTKATHKWIANWNRWTNGKTRPDNIREMWRVLIFFFLLPFLLLLSLFYICEEMLFSTITFVQMILVLILCIIFYTCALFLPLKRVNRDRYIWKESVIFSSCCFIYVKAVLLMKKKPGYCDHSLGMECFNFILFFLLSFTRKLQHVVVSRNPQNHDNRNEMKGLQHFFTSNNFEQKSHNSYCSKYSVPFSINFESIELTHKLRASLERAIK